MSLRIGRLRSFRALGLTWSMEEKEIGITFFKWELYLTWRK